MIQSLKLPYKLILSSQSPRRQELLKELGFPFRIEVKDVEESFPEGLQQGEIAVYLAQKKAAVFTESIKSDELLITADTIVWVNDTLLGKPKDKDDAFAMLKVLSNNKHTVYTGVCLKTQKKEVAFFSETHVYFKTLSKEEINYYIDRYKPFDKAGSYGIQEWIGFIGIQRIEGSYFNVMGLPVQRLYEELKKF